MVSALFLSIYGLPNQIAPHSMSPSCFTVLLSLITHWANENVTNEPQNIK